MIAFGERGHSLGVKPQPSKLVSTVRFRLPAPVFQDQGYSNPYLARNRRASSIILPCASILNGAAHSEGVSKVKFLDSVA